MESVTPLPSSPEADKSAGTPVVLVQRMSVRFDALQDRIALDVASGSNALARLWLTRRGADLLVQSAAARVEAYAATQSARAGVAPEAANQLRQSALVARQLTARLTQRQADEVALAPGAPQHLIVGFTMPEQGRRVQLDLHCQPPLRVRLQLQSAELFQWLAALQRQYRKGGWDLGVWPSWLAQRN